MALREILLLGDENLYKVSKAVSKDQLDKARQVVKDLHDTMMNFRKKYGFGRAIAAPQINELFRVIYVNFNDNAIALINPKLKFNDDERFQMWYDCVLEAAGDLSELIQHEYDHIDGILAVQRAIDNKSFRINKDKAGCF